MFIERYPVIDGEEHNEHYPRSHELNDIKSNGLFHRKTRQDLRWWKLSQKFYFQDVNHLMFKRIKVQSFQS